MKIVDKREAKKQLRRCALLYGEVYRSCSSGQLYIAARVEGRCVPVCLSKGDSLSPAVADECLFEPVDAELVIK